MFNIVNPLIEKYCLAHTSAENDLLQEINRITHLKTLNPRMLSGHLQGRLLSLLSKLINPTVALEVGTFTGYSTLCIAEGLSPNGYLYTIEANQEYAFLAKNFFEKSLYKNQIKLLVGDAHSVLPHFKETIDFAFIDADKKSYGFYFNYLADKIRSGGLLVADNVLWSGKVIDETQTDKETTLIKEFNNQLINDSRFEVLMLPIRDGLTVALKK
jgi:predicted O-methyltransferase YrrM